MWDLRDYLYYTDHTEIDYDKIVTLVKPIVESLKELPNYDYGDNE